VHVRTERERERERERDLCYTEPGQNGKLSLVENFYSPEDIV